MQKDNNNNRQETHTYSRWRYKMYKVIFEAETSAGKAFDIALLWAILLSVVAVMLESVKSIEEEYGLYLRIIEWVFTILFTIEYIARIVAEKKPLRYIFSFMGIVDILSIIPTYTSIFIKGTQSLLVIRTIRLLRVFRIFKLARYVGGAQTLIESLKVNRHKIIVFFGVVLSITIIMGTLLYLIEGGKNGFTSIPRSIYWAIVTLTTVGYGDIAPQTVLGQVLASIIMILGYSIIAVPAGMVVSASMIQKRIDKISTQSCPSCSDEGHDSDAKYCKFCGEKL